MITVMRLQAFQQQQQILRILLGHQQQQVVTAPHIENVTTDIVALGKRMQDSECVTQDEVNKELKQYSFEL